MDMTRNQLADHLQQYGYKNTSSVTKDCYALIVSDDNASSKYKKAQQLGVRFVNYWQNKTAVLNGDF